MSSLEMGCATDLGLGGHIGENVVLIALRAALRRRGRLLSRDDRQLQVVEGVRFEALISKVVTDLALDGRLGGNVVVAVGAVRTLGLLGGGDRLKMGEMR